MNIGNLCARMQRSNATGSVSSACIAALMLASCGGDTHLSFLDPQGPVASAQLWHFVEALALLVVFR